MEREEIDFFEFFIVFVLTSKIFVKYNKLTILYPIVTSFFVHIIVLLK
jgi:hypothetical protein